MATFGSRQDDTTELKEVKPVRENVNFNANIREDSEITRKVYYSKHLLKNFQYYCNYLF